MLAGDYQTAITTLRQAVQSASPGSLTYAYGLYDLGRSMVLAGDPGGAGCSATVAPGSCGSFSSSIRSSTSNSVAYRRCTSRSRELPDSSHTAP